MAIVSVMVVDGVGPLKVVDVRVVVVVSVEGLLRRCQR